MKELSAEQLKRILEYDPSLVLVSVQNPGAYARKHLRGSVHLRLKEPELTDLLVRMAQRGQPRLVVYDESPGENTTRDAAHLLEENGFLRVFTCPDGVEACQRAGIMTDSLAKYSFKGRQSSESSVVCDRTSEANARRNDDRSKPREPEDARGTRCLAGQRRRQS